MELLGEIERAFAAWIYPNRVLVGIVVAVVLAGLAIVAWRRRWDRLARRHPRLTVAVLAAAIVVGGPLAWYLGSPLFLSRTVDEAPPSPASTQSPGAGESGPPSTALSGLSGTFRGADEFHVGEGTARLIETAPGTYTLRLEDFAVRNGPDLYVLLSPSADGYAEDAVELGRLKADRGNQNYEVPAGTDVGFINSVVIWCKQFSVEFATAPLGKA
jgi:hypothetical protein